MHRTRVSFALVGATASVLLAGCEVKTESQATAQPAANNATADTGERPEINPKPVSSGDINAIDHGHSHDLEQMVATTPANWVIRPEPAELDLGTFSTKDTARDVITLHNTGDQPMTVERAQTSCGCTTTGLKPNTVIEPGGSVDVEIALTGGPSEGTKNKPVTFHIKDHPRVRVNVKGTSVMYVKYDPVGVTDPRALEDGRIVLRSIDDQPFRILSTSADIFKELPVEKAVEHEVFIDYEKAETQARLLKRLTFHVDHPRCDSVPTTLNLRLLYTPDPSIATHTKPTAINADTVNANPTIRTPTRPTNIWNAPRVEAELKAGNHAGVIEAIQNGDLNTEDRNRESSTLLDIAAQQGALDVMQALLDSGADVEAADKANRTPLMNAARSKQTEAVQMLIDNGARIDARDTIMNTALSWAAFQGTPETVQLLIESGSDVNIVGAATGWTPVIWASGFGDPASVTLLVEAGAELSTQDFIEGATALHHAARTGKAAHVQALLDAGADVAILDRNGKTPLIMACENSGGTVDKVKLLVDAGSDLAATDNRGLTALEHARNRTDGAASAVVEYLETLAGE